MTRRTSADARTAADDLRQRFTVSHLYKRSECTLPLPILLTSADGRIVADDVPQEISVWNPYKQSEYKLSLPTLLTSADARTGATAQRTWLQCGQVSHGAKAQTKNMAIICFALHVLDGHLLLQAAGRSLSQF